MTAVLLASTIVVVAVVPALAVSPDGARARLAPVALAAPVAPGVPEPAHAVVAPTPSPSPTPSPTATPSPAPSASPVPTPTPAPTPAPKPTPTPWPTPAWPTAVTTLGTTVRFYGLGYGHGVGLSQYGAKGRAQAGQTAEQILAAYFKGAVPSTTSGARAIRVLVLNAFPAPSGAPLVLYGRGGTWGLTGTDHVFPANAKLQAWRTTKTVDGVATTTWQVKVTDAGGAVLYGAPILGKPYLTPLEPSTYLQVDSRTSRYDTYRGRLRLILRASSVSVVNRLGLDQYLRGVVPAEMPVTWPREALRAQVIAARSFAVRDLNPTTGTYDTFDDTRSQIYRGIGGERAASDALIAAEPGAVITSGGTVVNAFFFSTGGGATENNEYVFVRSGGRPGTTRVAYLRGIIDRSPDGIPYDAVAPYFDWTTTRLSRSQLSAMLARDTRTNVGSLTKLDLRRRGVSGRLYQVVLYGSAGSKTVSAATFRTVYNANRPTGTRLLRSTLFDTRPIPLP